MNDMEIELMEPLLKSSAFKYLSLTNVSEIPKIFPYYPISAEPPEKNNFLIVVST
jgi:hypothetical protein